jgi:hypothetical protein
MMTRRRFSWIIALLACASTALPAIRASGAPPAPVQVASGSSSATAQVTSRLASDLTMAAKEAVVFVAPVRSDEPAPRGGELAGKLASMLAGALGSGASARQETVPLATAQALAHGAKALVYVQVEIARGQLRATADAYRVTRNVWDRARQPVPAPIAHAFATARIDGEVRSYLAPVPLVASHIDRVTTEDRDLLALACGDVDDDGTIEIVTLGRRRATIGRAQAGRFVALKTAWMRDLSGIASSPLREPLGGVAIVAARGPRPAHIDLGVTDRARGSRLDGDLRLLGSITGVPFTTAAGDACVTFQGSTLSAAIGKCAEADAAIDATDIEAPLDAAANATFVTADGAVHGIGATRDPRTSELKLRSGAETVTVAHAGAQIAVADLDQDGSPEIISTLDVPAKPANEPPGNTRKVGDGDALVISTWQPGTALRERARTPVPSGIRAVAVCPPDGGGAAPVVIATSGELWIIR